MVHSVGTLVVSLQLGSHDSDSRAFRFACMLPIHGNSAVMTLIAEFYILSHSDGRCQTLINKQTEFLGCPVYAIK